MGLSCRLLEVIAEGLPVAQQHHVGQLLFFNEVVGINTL